MYQIDTTDAVASPPASTPAGTAGYFTDGNAGTGAQATVLPAEFVNAVMREMLGVITDAGITPSKSTFTQLRDAVFGRKQTFSAYLNANQTGVVTATWTKVAFNAEEWDTEGKFDSTTNRRYQPTRAGKYQITAAAELVGSITGGVRLAVYKNGSLYKLGGFGHYTSGAMGASVQALVDMNGSTDYVEIYLYQDSGSNQAITGAATSTWVQGRWDSL